MNIDLIPAIELVILVVSLTINGILAFSFKRTNKNSADLQQLKDYINSEFAKLKQEMPSIKDIEDKIELVILRHEKECSRRPSFNDEDLKDRISKHEAHCEFVRKNYKL